MKTDFGWFHSLRQLQWNAVKCTDMCVCVCADNYPHLKTLDFSQMSLFRLLQPLLLCVFPLCKLHLSESKQRERFGEKPIMFVLIYGLRWVYVDPLVYFEGLREQRASLSSKYQKTNPSNYCQLKCHAVSWLLTQACWHGQTAPLWLTMVIMPEGKPQLKAVRLQRRGVVIEMTTEISSHTPPLTISISLVWEMCAVWFSQ